MNSVRCVAETRNLVGESPVWDAQRQRLFWTDINGMSVSRFEIGSGRVEQWKFHAPVSALALTSKPGWLLVAAGLQLLLWKVETDEREVFLDVEDAELGNRLNEGAADPDGNFWVGTMRNNVDADGAGIDVDWNDPRSHSGSLYRVSPDGAVTRQSSGLAIPNTMVWSPDRKTMYTGDSIANVLYAYDYRDGAVSGQRVFTKGFGRGVPDGSAMDEDGFLWNCRYFGNCLVRFDPTGNVDRVIEMPVRDITSCAFGGEDLGTLFVTTASISSGTGEPFAGAVFALQPGVRGLPENGFHVG
jgi:sugar lactone lactonase YvrE